MRALSWLTDLVALRAHALGVVDEAHQLLGALAHVEAPVLGVRVLVLKVCQLLNDSHV